jgi:hypothetical protein
VLPTLTLNVDNDTICFGRSSFINCQSNGTSFSWTPASTVDDPTSRDVTVSPTTTTTYTVVATRNGCTRSASTTIAVLPAPDMTHTQSSGGATICLDETDVITIDCPDCVSYVWKFPNSSLTTTSNVQTVSPNVSGAVQIIVSGIDEFGCNGTEVVTVNVDSCFIGSPFGIDRPVALDVQVLTKAESVDFVSNATVESLRMYNLLGEEVIFIQSNATTVSVTTASLSEGIYIARMVSGGQEIVKKVYLH